MMAGITFVRGEIDGAINVHRQIGVHLDDAAIISLVAIVTAPRRVRDVFNREIFEVDDLLQSDQCRMESAG
jgi:hypothetical protein